MIAIKKNCFKVYKLFFIAVLALLAPISASYADEDADASLPVPRFASLRSNEVNMRVGPGARYSINWVYKHESLPVEIIQEFDQWREIRDSEGTTGWVNKQMLQGKRMAVVKGNLAVLRRSPDPKSHAIIRAESGVIGKLIECDVDWCKLQIAGHKGWIEKSNIWGAYKKEKF
jgi:SH3-like domain-containing protein